MSECDQFTEDSQSENGSKCDVNEAHDKTFYDSFPFKSHKFNRFLVISILQEYIESGASVKTPVRCVDVVSDCGGNGLFWKLTFGSSIDVVVNNCEAQIAELIERNASLNNLKVCVANKDPCVLLHERGYNFVYLDCKTEAAQCFDAAVRNISRQGIFVVTTNDDSSLHGGDNNVAFRRYGGRITRTTYAAELGIRLFIAALARSAARHDRAIRVLLCAVYKSTFTVAIMCLNGASLANRVIKEEIRSLKHCMVCEERVFYPPETEFPVDHNSVKLPCECSKNAPGETCQVLGPLWSGDLFDRDFIDRMLFRGLVGDQFLEKELKTILEESKCPSKEDDNVGGKRMKMDHVSSPPFYYNVHKHHPRSEQQVTMNKIINELRNAGFRASRTHFDKVSIRTNANMREMAYIIKKIGEK
ncbi:TRMT1-like protein [Cimex lectularius]|uniref:Uncharacterized protein n=1 Tax=Cimex lectularius TaxID=79782 RepID=A0A8I6RSB8_CIMLE|nr:TRMT1-like protein [Cimex lectularius]